MIAVADHEAFDLGPLTLQRGLTLPKAHIVYKTYGTLAPDKSNVILYPTSYGAHHTDIDWLIGRERVLDSERYFIVIPNQFGKGLSTSPSNLASRLVSGAILCSRTGTMCMPRSGCCARNSASHAWLLCMGGPWAASRRCTGGLCSPTA